jgi:hypothetical protein
MVGAAITSCNAVVDLSIEMTSFCAACHAMLRCMPYLATFPSQHVSYLEYV